MQIICAINKNSALVESNISLALAADSHIFAINSAKHQLKQHHVSTRNSAKIPGIFDNHQQLLKQQKQPRVQNQRNALRVCDDSAVASGRQRGVRGRNFPCGCDAAMAATALATKSNTWATERLQQLLCCCLHHWLPRTPVSCVPAFYVYLTVDGDWLCVAWLWLACGVACANYRKCIAFGSVIFFVAFSRFLWRSCRYLSWSALEFCAGFLLLHTMLFPFFDISSIASLCDLVSLNCTGRYCWLFA